MFHTFAIPELNDLRRPPSPTLRGESSLLPKKPVTLPFLHSAQTQEGLYRYFSQSGKKFLPNLLGREKGFLFPLEN